MIANEDLLALVYLGIFTGIRYWGFPLAKPFFDVLLGDGDVIFFWGAYSADNTSSNLYLSSKSEWVRKFTEWCQDILGYTESSLLSP